MKTTSLTALGLTLWLLTVFHAAAHSTEEVLNDIRQNERYFQITHSVAPDSGRPVDATREARDAGSSRPDA